MKNIRRKKKRNFRNCIVLLIVLAVVCLAGIKVFIYENNQTVSGADDQKNGIDLEHLYSPYAILADANSGEILAEHRS